MTNSLKKNETSRSRPQAERVLMDRTNMQHTQAARSSSHKKQTAAHSGAVALNNGSSSARSVSSKKKKKAAWDDTIQDLSVHKLAKAQLQAKHDMMKRAAREHSRERIGLPRTLTADVMSPPAQRGHQRSASLQSARGRSRSPASFTSPASDSSAPSSAASTPDSLQQHDSDSAASTPSPQEIVQRRRQQPQQPQQTVLSVRPQVPRQVRPVKQAAAPAPLPAAPMTRMSAAPVITSAPVSLENSFADEEEHDNSFSAFAPAPGSAPSAPIANYSPWLKPNNVLSPVLERSIVDSAASTPSAPNQQQQAQQQQQQQALDRPFFTDLSNAPSLASSPQRPAAAAPASRRNDHGAQQSEEKQGSGRNLLDELRQSLDHPAADSQQQQQQPQQMHGATLANLPLPTQHHFMSLLRQVVTHLSEREATASQEAQFKANTVASISGCTAQLKQMSLRIEQVEREKLEILEQNQTYQRDMQAMQQRLAMMEQRLEMMNGGRPLQQPVPQLQLQPPAAPNQNRMQQQPQQSAAYDPSLYHSQHSNTLQSKSTSVLPNVSLFHSSNYNNTPAPAPAATAVRSQSPPRPIVINHATQLASMQSQSQPPQSRGRPHEVSVQLTDSFKPLTTNTVAGGARNMAPTPVVATHKVAWQTYQAKPNQQQQPPQQPPQQTQHIQPHQQMQQQVSRQSQHPQAALSHSHSHPASRFHPSHPIHAAADDLDDGAEDAEEEEEADAAGSGDLDDETPRSSMHHASERFAPFSPGSEQDEEEARQFAEQAARMRQGAFHAQQQQQQQRR